MFPSLARPLEFADFNGERSVSAKTTHMSLKLDQKSTPCLGHNCLRRYPVVPHIAIWQIYKIKKKL